MGVLAGLFCLVCFGNPLWADLIIQTPAWPCGLLVPSRSSVVWLLAQLAQQGLLALQEFDAERIARARQRDRHLGLDPSGMRRHYDHPVGEIDRFGYVVGHVDHG